MLLARKLSSLVNKGLSDKAVGLFHHLHRSGNHITGYEISAAIRACTRLQLLKEGQQLQCMSWKQGSNMDMIVMTSLVDMYSKCAFVEGARRVFDEMPLPDVIATSSMISGLCRCNSAAAAIALFNDMPERDLGSWNSIISGLGQNSEGKTALAYFEKMRAEGIGADLVTMVSVLSVCADLAALANGRKIHCLVAKQGFELYLPVGNALVDMYSKCSCMDDARLCFDNMPWTNVVSWTSLIVGYGKYRAGLEAIIAFDQMESAGVAPNKITFLGILFLKSGVSELLMLASWALINHGYLQSRTLAEGGHGITFCHGDSQK
uniref:Pentatricopeptide repeat-containing protein n=1 Tax=Kalanchoe fedtschenkoi TaxID=63787 RepID=A0A7N0VK53_KALFE